MPDGVIHRDIKPSNVLLDGLWTAKLSDVGLGKILSIEAMTSIRMSASRNMTSKIVGTFSYMDPEYISSGQVCGEFTYDFMFVSMHFFFTCIQRTVVDLLDLTGFQKFNCTFRNCGIECFHGLQLSRGGGGRVPVCTALC